MTPKGFIKVTHIKIIRSGDGINEIYSNIPTTIPINNIFSYKKVNLNYTHEDRIKFICKGTEIKFKKTTNYKKFEELNKFYKDNDVSEKIDYNYVDFFISETVEELDKIIINQTNPDKEGIIKIDKNGRIIEEI